MGASVFHGVAIFSTPAKNRGRVVEMLESIDAEGQQYESKVALYGSAGADHIQIVVDLRYEARHVSQVPPAVVKRLHQALKGDELYDMSVIVLGETVGAAAA